MEEIIFTYWSSQPGQKKTRNNQICKHGERSSKTDAASKTPSVNKNIENGLANIRIDIGNTRTKLVNILNKEQE